MQGIELTVEELVAFRQSFAGVKRHHHQNIKTIQKGYRLSKIKGHGIDFDEVREYQFGDDIRSIDWKTTAKLQKTYSKTYKEERERPVFILVDFNPQMFFGTKYALKSVIAARLAVLIAYLAAHHQDRVGGVIYGYSHIEVKPQANKAGIQGLIRALVHIHNQSSKQSHYDNGLLSALMRIRRSIKPGSLLFVLSDFSSFDKQEQALASQIARHNDVVLSFIYDHLERYVPKPGQYLVNDGKHHKLLSTYGQKIRARYENIFKEKQQKLLEFCQQNNQSLMPISSEDDLAQNLLDSLIIFRK